MPYLKFEEYLAAAENSLLAENLSVHARELDLPTRVERDLEVEKVIERPLSTLWLKGKATPIRLTREEWWHLVRGKANILDVRPGDRVDIEYYDNRANAAREGVPIMSIHIRDGGRAGSPAPRDWNPSGWVYGNG